MEITTRKENTIINCGNVKITFPTADLFRHFNRAFLCDTLTTILDRIGIESTKVNRLVNDDNFIERWLEAVANDDTINICLDQLAGQCIHAEENKDQGNLPMFKVGDTAIYNSTKKTPLALQYSGKSVTVLKVLPKENAQIWLRYQVQFMDGYVVDVFENELSFTQPQIVSEKVPHEFVQNLAKYDFGNLLAPQIRELCSYFAIMVDASALLSPFFEEMLRTKILPWLCAEKMQLQVEKKTVDYISGLATGPSPSQCAIKAKHLLIWLHNHNLLRICSASDDASSLSANAALVEIIRQCKDQTVCLITEHFGVVERLCAEDLPKCICAGLWQGQGLFIHPATKDRLMNLCWNTKEGGASE